MNALGKRPLRGSVPIERWSGPPPVDPDGIGRAIDALIDFRR